MLFFLFGKDTFRSQEKMRALKEKFLSNDRSGAGLSILDFEEKITFETFREALSAASLFSPKRMVIALNCIQSATPETQKQILALLKEKSNIAEDKELTLIFWEQGEPRKNNALYKFLFDKAKKQAFTPLEGKLLETWSKEWLAKNAPTTTIEPQAFSLLSLYTNNDLRAMEMELQKLSAFKPDGAIKQEDVQLLVKSQASLTIFETIEAITSKNKSRALELLHQQIALGADPFYLLSMYAYQLRNLLKISDAFTRGVTNQYAIAKEVGLHPFVVQKGLSQIKNLPLEKLLEMYREIQQIDQDAKTGKTNLLLALDTFIAKL